MPLKAWCENRGQITYYSELIEEDRHSQDYSCPICKDRFSVVLPITADFIPQFRHQNNAVHGEPETPEHLEMKAYFMDACKKHGINFRIEEQIQDHWADVVIEYTKPELNIKGIVVECQHSSISLDEIEIRNNTYLTSQYTPVWVWGPDYKKRANNIKHQLLRKTEKKNYDELGVVFFYENKQLYWANLHFITEYSVTYNLNKISFDKFLEISSGETLNDRLDSEFLIKQRRYGAYYFNLNDKTYSYDPLIKHPRIIKGNIIFDNNMVGGYSLSIVSQREPGVKLVLVPITPIKLKIGPEIWFRRKWSGIVRENEISNYGVIELYCFFEDHQKIINDVAWLFNISLRDDND